MSQSNSVWLPQLAWYGDTELELRFPSSWEIEVCHMRGHDWPVLSEQELRNAFEHPVGSKRIRELARGVKDVAIIFDDMTRPTPVAQIVPYVLAELREAGVTDENIRFIVALGAHGAHNHIDFRKKLGESVAEKYPVYNHNPYENCKFVGTTSWGTPVSVNAEVMSCDLKIGIGCIVPHPFTGFGGGGKIILPGVASIDTIEANHGPLMQRAIESGQRDSIGLGHFDNNIIHLDVNEAARLAGLDIKIDAIVNLRREIAALFVGEVAAVHTEGVRVAREFYATEPVDGADIVIANAYSKANEAGLAIPVGARLIRENGGDLVILANTPEGQVTHYVMRSFGKSIGGRLWQPRSRLPSRVNRLMVFTPHIDRAGADWLAPPEAIIWLKTWDDVLKKLKMAYPGAARVVVIPDATVQYFPS